jgi:ParB-like chromosome segregation protein Spo0J
MRFVRNKYKLVKSLVEDGPKDPILVKRETLRLCDGSHRLPILQAMGYKSVIVREI